jgi:iron complex outermembrane recepter protein
MKLRTTAFRKSTLAAGGAVLAIASASSAYAQSTSQNAALQTEDAAAETAEAPAADDQQSDSGIIVTGTRIPTNGFDTPNPVTVLSADTLQQRAPSNVPDGLNQLPQFVNSQSPASRQRATVNTQVQVGNFLNLRGLGSQRSLILLDGIRVPPTSPDGSVSIDTLPQTLIQRVDVVTGGASAVYGSDAVVGVVNFVLDKKFTGIRVNGQAGISDYGDASSYKLGLTAGTALLDDRLRLLGSVERYSSGVISRFDDRPLSKAGLNYCNVGAGTAASPFRVLTGCHSQIATYGGLIRSGVLAGNEFLPDGSIRPFNAGGLGGVGGVGAVLPTSQDLQVPLETWQVFGRAAYELSPALGFHVQASWAESVNGPYDHGATVLTAGSPQGLIIQSENAFLSPAIRALLPANSTFQLGRWVDPEMVPVGKVDLPIPYTTQTSRSLMINTGVSGSLGGSWKWDLNYVHGETKFRSSTHEVNMLKLFAAVDAVRDASNNIVCRVTLTNPGLYPGCVAFNPFGQGAPSQAAVDYVFGDSIWSVRNIMDIGSANITGTPFSTWAGPVGIAIGGEIRRQSLRQMSNADPAVPIDFTGLRGLPTGTPVRFNTVNVGSANGEVDVKEVYGEITVPLARDIPALDRLDLSGAVRYTDYSTSGGVTTWKLGLDYRPFDDLRLRVTRSRDIRAPSLYDLFAGTQQSLRVITDPHTGISQPVLSLVQGNSTLTPEIGNTLTYGAVYEPSWLPGFGISVDAYDIRIEDAISPIDPVVALQSCEDSGGTGPTCSLITRPLPFSDRTAANFPSSVLQVPINVATLRQKGIDFEASYRFSALGGDIELRGLASHIYDLRTDLGFNQPVQQSAGYRTIPKWRGSLSASFQTERFGIFVQERFTGSYNMSIYRNLTTGADAQFFADHGRAPNYGYTDVTLTAKPFYERGAELFFTVNNLFNTTPPVLFPSGNNSVNLYYPTIRTSYDIVGRYFTAGFRVKF